MEQQNKIPFHFLLASKCKNVPSTKDHFQLERLHWLKQHERSDQHRKTRLKALSLQKSKLEAKIKDLESSIERVSEQRRAAESKKNSMLDKITLEESKFSQRKKQTLKNLRKYIARNEANAKAEAKAQAEADAEAEATQKFFFEMDLAKEIKQEASLEVGIKQEVRDIENEWIPYLELPKPSGPARDPRLASYKGKIL